MNRLDEDVQLIPGARGQAGSTGASTGQHRRGARVRAGWPEGATLTVGADATYRVATEAMATATSRTTVPLANDRALGNVIASVSNAAHSSVAIALSSPSMGSG